MTMVTQNHFVIPATVLEKLRSRGFPEGVTLTADHCIDIDSNLSQISLKFNDIQGKIMSDMVFFERTL